MGVPIIILFPLLVLLTISENTYHLFFRVARFWAAIIIYGMGFWPVIKREEKMDKGQSYMLVANHTSMTDIMMMLLISRNPFVFVGKKELAKIPIFGFFYKRTCILVDRKNPRSRKEVFDRARKRMHDGVGICIFPEGGVPEDQDVVLDTFKDGAFRLAIEHQIPLLPITLFDNKKRFPFHFFQGSPGIMRAKTHAAIETKGMDVAGDKARFRESVRNIILHSLEKA
ncbi:1-acyl-sn-glycerol-3-phosphate acyltransferase [Nonlabens dokdonensis]|uniref:1-acyl-sn-glycerol-3-phosphate acyltransferase n=3 Tax=Nonlabens dokdonensis TaxID=328515 RepID=L7W8Y1_NONDD|nr:1-acyl-sn-glycerol-3-phosphate acyltransferase [Nonlabens dokdonensis DSW-6]PZX44268.1 1-acyl-sn-glycerol-3-phosphate acyltransferase [Nonlabens dokdonensis]